MKSGKDERLEECICERKKKKKKSEEKRKKTCQKVRNTNFNSCYNLDVLTANKLSSR